MILELEEKVLKTAHINNETNNNFGKLEEFFEFKDFVRISANDCLQGWVGGSTNGNSYDVDVTSLVDFPRNPPRNKSDTLESITKEDDLVSILLTRNQLETHVAQSSGNVGVLSVYFWCLLHPVQEPNLFVGEWGDAVGGTAVLNGAKVSRCVRQENGDHKVNEVLLVLKFLVGDVRITLNSKAEVDVTALIDNVLPEGTELAQKLGVFGIGHKRVILNAFCVSGDEQGNS